MSGTNPTSQRGLSLLELLVVFVIISMVSVVLIQGFGFGLALYERVESRGQRVAGEVLAAEWFRRVNRALVAATEPGQSLIGDDRGFEAETLNPLLGRAGLPVQVSWLIDRGQLIYREGDVPLIIAPVAPGAEIAYRDAGGNLHGHWPLDPGDDELPAAIAVRAGGAVLYNASIGMRLRANLLLEESHSERR